MESQIWYQLASSVGEGLENGQWPLLTLMSDTSVSPCISLVPFKLLHWCWTQRERVWAGETMCGLFKGTAWGSSIFFHWHDPYWFCSQKLWELTFLALKPKLGGLVWCCESSLTLYPSQIFIHHMWVWDQSVLVCAPPTSLDGCGFFNYVVVILPFNSISDGTEWRLFYILVVISEWLGEEASHVCLHCHLL